MCIKNSGHDTVNKTYDMTGHLKFNTCSNNDGQPTESTARNLTVKLKNNIKSQQARKVSNP